MVKYVSGSGIKTSKVPSVTVCTLDQEGYNVHWSHCSKPVISINIFCEGIPKIQCSLRNLSLSLQLIVVSDFHCQRLMALIASMNSFFSRQSNNVIKQKDPPHSYIEKKIVRGTWLCCYSALHWCTLLIYLQFRGICIIKINAFDHSIICINKAFLRKWEWKKNGS